MNQNNEFTQAPDGRVAPLLRAGDADEAGRWLQPGVIVEVPPVVADECGAWLDDCLDAAEAFEAAEDPAEFGDAGSDAPS